MAVYCIVTVLYIIFEDPTEKHFGEVGILNKLL